MRGASSLTPSPPKPLAWPQVVQESASDGCDEHSRREAEGWSQRCRQNLSQLLEQQQQLLLVLVLVLVLVLLLLLLLLLLMVVMLLILLPRSAA